MKGALITGLCLCFSAVFSAPINSKEVVSINGIQQWIQIKSVDRTLPVMLYLHGGPGNSAMAYAEKFTKELQKHFVVVMWDQRESGNTATLNKSSAPLTVSLVTADAIEMIDYLRNRFVQDKIYLMGHSWGGFLALYVASLHAEKLHACFALAPMVNQQKSERDALNAMTESATVSGDQQAIAELRTVHIPFENGEQLYTHRKWLSKMMGSATPKKLFVVDWSLKWLSLFNEGSAVNFFESVPELNCPVYFFVGARDYQTSSNLTEAYFRSVKAQKKDLFWFTNSAHSLNLTEPTKLQEIVISLKEKP